MQKIARMSRAVCEKGRFAWFAQIALFADIAHPERAAQRIALGKRAVRPTSVIVVRKRGCYTVSGLKCNNVVSSHNRNEVVN